MRTIAKIMVVLLVIIAALFKLTAKVLIYCGDMVLGPAEVLVERYKLAPEEHG